MKLILKPSLLKLRTTRIKYIIIHQSTCQYNVPESKIDNSKFQIPGLISQSIEKKQPDLNFHFIVDKIKDDYQLIVCRPFMYVCEFDDIDSEINRSALHISLIGSYDLKIPDQRLYNILSYRLLNPLLRHFKITPDKIYFHRDISNNKKESCPGSFINKEKLISAVRRFVVK